MKTTFALFIGISSLLLAVSCSSETETKTTSTVEKNAADSLKVEEWFPETNFDTLRGMYTGDFGDGFINIVLTYVNDKKAIGYNIHKGLQRNISGSVVQKKEAFELTLNEPGDNQYDGIFVLTISKKDGSVNASWTANNPKISSKKFKLKKQQITKNDDSKSIYEGGEFSENSFMEFFSYANLGVGNVEFKENGIVRFSYYPEGQENEQLEIINGSWKFTDKKTLVIEWSKNALFKERSMKFKLKQDEDNIPSFEGPNELIIYPDIF
ncbi:hypothetical protein [Fluviicola taffensis]|uniref:Lipoprotein n=1 Tax=Fluviicola taffensis (strain DSM 16823 / NCIMB 13979 / RW262) TaxID=755732 RepID=F2IAC9_FLUTR|nr:hypothetical protein [Fluviicola taffensis]AEA42064.1 hypothetical protein Fluta_0054 [Fluviicola taffensis DSM 16823]